MKTETKFEKGYIFYDKKNQENKVIYFNETQKMYWIETLIISTSMYFTGSFMSEEYINLITKK